MKKSDEVKLYHKGKSDGKDDHQKKIEGVRVPHYRERWVETSP